MNRRSVKLAGVITLVSALLAIPQTVVAEPAAQPVERVAAVPYTADSKLADAELPVDPVTFEECEDHTMNGEPLWFKNRYSVCTHLTQPIIHVVRENGVLVPVGTSTFYVTFIGVAVDKEHQIKFSMRVKYLGSTGKADMSTRLSFMLECRNDHPDRASTCDYPALVQKTIGLWASPGGDEPFSWTTTTRTTAVPADMYQEELRGYFNFDVKTITEGSAGNADTGTLVDTEYFRCDSATYATRGSRCVFTSVTPIMIFELNSDHGESADFIKGAQEGRQDILNDNPQLVGKKVPGKFGDEDNKLEYLVPKYDTDNTKTGSRNKVRKVCATASGAGYTKDANGNARQCDEYPFASTYQNSAKVDEDDELSFAAKAIAASHNMKGGTLMSSWYGREHMLDGDDFYVAVR